MSPDRAAVRRGLVLGAALCAAASVASLPAALAAPPAVFINELHYDNVGGDADQGVEIAGPAGTNLAGWTIVAYNGLDGASYAETSLAGVVPAQDAGFGTLFFARSLQNGAPDGVALVDTDGNVVQTLGYEGSFTATQGIASGGSFTDIGRFERPSTPLGHSLQLSGSGTTSADFAWGDPAPASPGRINDNQSFARPSGTHTSTVSAKAAPGATVAASGTAASACISRRRIRLRVAIASKPALVGGTLRIAGRPAVALERRFRTVLVDLRGMPRKQVLVTVSAMTADGRTTRLLRRFRTCAPRSASR